MTTIFGLLAEALVVSSMAAVAKAALKIRRSFFFMIGSDSERSLAPSAGNGRSIFLHTRQFHGETDELGDGIGKDPVHVHDFNATILHLLSIDHERLTFRYHERQFRLTDVHGKVVTGVLA